jgi:predicted RNase H-like nuclease (RuvC/YqgF family)
MPTLASTTDRINVLVDRIESGDYPDRARLEETLTEGYAWALRLDAECGRLERRISANAEQLANGSNEEQARELSALARLLTHRRQERDILRARLARLRTGVREAPVA